MSEKWATVWRFSSGLLPALGLLITGACAHHGVNAALGDSADPDEGYRFGHLTSPGASDELFLVLSFSGGGTRAATLAYGVLAELSRIDIPTRDGGSSSLLDEVDVISSVSGGSFTAAYYALFGEETLFRCFEEEFLRRNVQGALVRRLVLPWNWFRLASPHWDRIDLAADWYDRHVFHGATFDDLVQKGERPFIILNATDMGAGNRFEFTQDRFDYLCSDLSTFAVARAVAASSAFPGLLSPVTLRNHACRGLGQECGLQRTACGFQPPVRVTYALKDEELNPQRYLFARDRVGYLDPERDYIHLLDGGVADNLGLRAILDAFSEVSSWSLVPVLNRGEVGRILVIVVNAQRDPENDLDRRQDAPWLLPTLQTAATTPMAHYSTATVRALKEVIQDFYGERVRDQMLLRTLRRRCPDCALGEFAGEFTPTPVHDVEVSFQKVEDPDARRGFETLPTSFRLPDEAIDDLIRVGSTVLRENREFQELLRELGATRRDRSPFGACRRQVRELASRPPPVLSERPGQPP